jgi:hypothetical protein
MFDLMALLERPGITLDEITAHLDKLNTSDRALQVVTLGKKHQMKLWDLAADSRQLDLSYLVPKDAQPLAYFPFEGKNSLPAFKRFQKVFYFDAKGNICGYNNNPSLVEKVIGPGYFMVQMNPRAGKEIQIDYTRIPTEKPPKWPAIKSNDVFPTMFVYGGTKDNLRWVSKDVVIGRAYKMGEEPMPNWFVLCRVDPPR